VACHFAKLACHLPTTKPIPAKQHFHTALSTLNGDDSGFVVQGQTVEEIEKLPFP
jgi:hypothetical protein